MAGGQPYKDESPAPAARFPQKRGGTPPGRCPYRRPSPTRGPVRTRGASPPACPPPRRRSANWESRKRGAVECCTPCRSRRPPSSQQIAKEKYSRIAGRPQTRSTGSAASRWHRSATVASPPGRPARPRPVGPAAREWLDKKPPGRTVQRHPPPGRHRDPDRSAGRRQPGRA